MRRSLEDDHGHDRRNARGEHDARGEREARGEHEAWHAHGGGTGMRHALRDVFRPHSHDAADIIDSAMVADRRGLRAVRISFVALLVTSGVQAAVFLLTGSVALLADTIHNFSDALTAIPLFLAFRIGRRSPNRRYTYGYRRAEDFAGLFVIAMIAVSSFVAAAQAISRLIHPRHVDHVGVLLVAGLVGFAGNELVAVFRMREGKAIGSAALLADGYHARTDGFTSLAVALGALGVWAGFRQADPLVGLAIALAIFAVLRGAARQIWYRLMDAVDPAIVERIEAVAAGIPGVSTVHSVHARWLGHRLVAELSAAVDGSLPVRDGHAIAADLSHRLLHDVRHLDEVHVHVDPADLDVHRHSHEH